MKVDVTGEKLVVTLNGEVVNEVALDAGPLASRHKTGAIGFQDHALPVKLRNFRITKKQAARVAKGPAGAPRAPGRAIKPRALPGDPRSGHVTCRQLPSLQQPSQGPFLQQQHPQSSQVHLPLAQQPQQSHSGHRETAPPDSGARANAAQRIIADMVQAPWEKV